MAIYHIWDWTQTNIRLLQLTGATLGISTNEFTTPKESHFILNIKISLVQTGSPAEVLEIHGFTGTQGTRPNAAPDNYVFD